MSCFGLPRLPTPPTSGSAGLPAPFSPWHAWQCAAYTASPCLGVPLPAGRPSPLGGMLMSQAAISRAAAARPSPGPVVGAGDSAPVVAQDAVTVASAMPVMARLNEDIGDAPVGRHFPGLNRMIVIAG